ncbi:MAG: Fic family protein [Cyanobacteria bacterium P01_F01_bin.143]
MGRIRKTQPLSSLIKYVKQEEWLNLIDKYQAIDLKGRYLHWDQFQWRVDKGDDVDAAWLATKISRRAIAKKLLLLQAKNELCFSYCIPNSLLAQLQNIDAITGGGYSLSNSIFIVSSQAEKDRYLVKNLMMEEAITSSQLEGASTTRKVAKKILENNLPPKNKSEQMIVNNFQLMKEVLARQEEELSIDMILDLHSIATDQAIENQAIPGQLRQDDNIYIADQFNENFYQPPSWETLEERLNNLCSFANECHGSQNYNNFIHPIIKAIILHFMIGYIHPFGDGNGRTARAIFYWFMLRAGYWLFEYVSISKLIKEKRSAYDTAFIYTETDDFDLTYFIYNQVEIIVKAINALQTHIEDKKQELSNFVAWIDKSPLAKKLKRGHLEILKEAIKEPGKEFTSKQVAMSLGISENTARSYLKKLADLDLLILATTKKGRMVRYVAPASLKEKMI